MPKPALSPSRMASKRRPHRTCKTSATKSAAVNGSYRTASTTIEQTSQVPPTPLCEFCLSHKLATSRSLHRQDLRRSTIAAESEPPRASPSEAGNLEYTLRNKRIYRNQAIPFSDFNDMTGTPDPLVGTLLRMWVHTAETTIQRNDVCTSDEITSLSADPLPLPNFNTRPHKVLRKLNKDIRRKNGVTALTPTALKRNTAFNQSIDQNQLHDDLDSFGICFSNSDDDDGSEEDDLVNKRAKKRKTVSFHEDEVTDIVYVKPWIRRNYMEVHEVDSALAAVIWHRENANDDPDFERLVEDAEDIIELSFQRRCAMAKEALAMPLSSPESHSNSTTGSWEPLQPDLRTEADSSIAHESTKAANQTRALSQTPTEAWTPPKIEFPSLEDELESLIDDENAKTQEKARNLFSPRNSPYITHSDQSYGEAYIPPPASEAPGPIPSSCTWNPQVDLPDADDELEQIIQEEERRAPAQALENPDYTPAELARAQRCLFNNSPTMRRVAYGFDDQDQTWSRPATPFYITRPARPSLLRDVVNVDDELAFCAEVGSVEEVSMDEQIERERDTSAEQGGSTTTPPESMMADRTVALVSDEVEADEKIGGGDGRREQSEQQPTRGSAFPICTYNQASRKRKRWPRTGMRIKKRTIMRMSKKILSTTPTHLHLTQPILQV